MPGDGFRWYDTGQEHIITDSTFRNCGYRSEEYSEYDSSPDRGCGDDFDSGCTSSSAVFEFLSHSSEHNPEVMQGTRNISIDSCGRRFSYSSENESVSGRLQNWFDQDGSASGLGVPSVIASGYNSSGMWWKVDDFVRLDSHGPVQLIDLALGPERDLGHVKLYFDEAEHSRAGSSICTNDVSDPPPCPPLGYVKHLGPRFNDDLGLPVTAQSDIVGMTGGFGWLLTFNNGSPIRTKISRVEVKPSTVLVLAIPYPMNVGLRITQYAAYCDEGNLCEYEFTQVSSVEQVRRGQGDVYYVDPTDGVLYVRVVQTALTHLGYTSGNETGWHTFDYDDLGVWGDHTNGYKLPRFERGGVLLPKAVWGPELIIQVTDCAPDPKNNAYCLEKPNESADPNPCDSFEGYTKQTAYDTCCKPEDPTSCMFANGESSADI